MHAYTFPFPYSFTMLNTILNATICYQQLELEMVDSRTYKYQRTVNVYARVCVSNSRETEVKVNGE